MEKDKFENAKRILERIEHFKQLKGKVYATGSGIEENRNLPSIREEEARKLANLIISIIEAKDYKFVLTDFICMIAKSCDRAIMELEEEFKML